MIAVATSVLAVACAPNGPPTALELPPAPAPQPSPAMAASTKAAPRWVAVTGLAGTGDQATRPFDIAAGVLQWRVTATCSSGHLRISLVGEAEPLIDQDCPGRFFGFSIRTGGRALEVQATGMWEAVVDQQVDTPVTEPPLPGMTSASRLAAGTFAGVEQDGGGTATLYRLPGGGHALRLDPFFVTANDDLFVWASEAEAPRTSAEALHSPHVELEALKATAGTQNYVLPDTLPVDRVRSIVIWCEPVRTAYAAAPFPRR